MDAHFEAIVRRLIYVTTGIRGVTGVSFGEEPSHAVVRLDTQTVGYSILTQCLVCSPLIFVEWTAAVYVIYGKMCCEPNMLAFDARKHDNG